MLALALTLTFDVGAVTESARPVNGAETTPTRRDTTPGQTQLLEGDGTDEDEASGWTYSF